MSWYSEKIKPSPLYTQKQRTEVLSLLYPSFLFPLVTLFARARNEGLSVALYETYRSQERQLELFNQGATTLKKNGMHHFGVACDIVFLTATGNPSWAATHNWARLGAIGKSVGLEWGGSWSGFTDKPHFQLIPATVAAQAKIIAGEYPSYPSSLNAKIPGLLQLYAQAKLYNFSPAYISQILAYLGSSPVPVVPLFSRTLSQGMKGADVLLLQKVLNADPATRIATSGAGSPGHESDYFGALTKTALQKFQVKYGIAAPSNPAYGTAGPKTRAKLQEVANALHL